MARLALLGSILTIPFSGLVTWKILTGSITMLELPGMTPAVAKFMTYSIVAILLISLSIVLDRKMWRAALKK